MAPDDHEVDVSEKGKLEFWIWGLRFTEDVRVASKLPIKLLIRSKFWPNHGLFPDLRTMNTTSFVQGRPVCGNAFSKRCVMLQER